MASYGKQQNDLAGKLNRKEIGYLDLINMVIEARIERDKLKQDFKDCKKANDDLARKIQIAGNHLERAKKFLVLN